MTSFMDRILSPSENLVEEVRTHWWEMASSSLILMVTVLVVLVLELGSLLTGSVGFLVGSGAILLSLIFWVIHYVKWRTKYLLLTDRRVVVVTGVIAHRTNEIPINRITDIRCDQGVLGRILNFGSINIQSAGAEGTEGIGNVSAPFELRNRINALSEMSSTSEALAGRTGSTNDASDAVEALERLARLYQADLISKDDYIKMKSKLIG